VIGGRRREGGGHGERGHENEEEEEEEEEEETRGQGNGLRSNVCSGVQHVRAGVFSSANSTSRSTLARGEETDNVSSCSQRGVEILLLI